MKEDCVFINRLLEPCAGKLARTVLTGGKSEKAYLSEFGRGLYYGSYQNPRTLVWSIGVVIFILMILTAFLGYVLVYGQMSHWGVYKFYCPKCLFNKLFLLFLYLDEYTFHLFNSIYSDPYSLIMPLNVANQNRIKGIKRIGPHDKVVYSVIFGSLLGDAHAERRNGGAGTRISFQQENIHVSYLLWLHNLLASRGYCNENTPKVSTRLGHKGKIRKYSRFHTWTYTSFNFIHDLWYVNKVKIIPLTIKYYLTPLALAIWIMDDGAKVSKGLKLCTNSYTYPDCLLLLQVLHENFGLKASVISAGLPNQYNIYIWKESMPNLRQICYPYIIPEMRYKIIE